MRDIIFRGKRIDNGEWIQGNLVTEKEGLHSGESYILPTIADFTYGDNGNRIRIGCFVQVEPQTIGQYTGLLDKIGKRIFDGDIVRVRQGKENGKATIYYGNGAFSVMSTSGNILERTLWEYWYNDWDIEVVGNIHDNPELLEVTI